MLSSQVKNFAGGGLENIRRQNHSTKGRGKGESLLPHIGWNQLMNTDLSLSLNMKTNLEQYFVHSFCASEVPVTTVLYSCRYGSDIPFPAAVLKDNVAGFQFHPEKWC